MDKFNSLSRRESLLGIGAAGTLLGGGALGVSSAVAGEDSKDETDDASDGETVTSKKGRFELGLVCYEKGTAEFSVSNESGADAKVEWTVDLGSSVVDGTDTDADDGDVDEDFDPDGETIEDGEEVDDDGDDDDDDNGDAENGTGESDYTLEGKLTIPEGTSETFRADVVSKDATVALYHDGKKVAAVDVEKLDCEKYSPADEIDLEAVCYRTRKDDDYYDGDADGEADDGGETGDGETGDGETGDGDVSEDFDPDGETIEDGEEVDDDDDDGDETAEDGDLEDGDVENGDTDADKRTVREVKFRVSNDGKQTVKTNWTVQGDGQGGKCYVDGKDSETFWVTALENQKTYVSLTYEGEEVATVKADATTKCDGDC